MIKSQARFRLIVTIITATIVCSLLLAYNFARIMALNQHLDNDRQEKSQDSTETNSNIAYIDSGAYHNCVITLLKTVKCWGRNFHGQLGSGQINISGRAVPTDVVNLTDGVHSIALGEEHSCAVSDKGNIKCWGANAWGQLGTGTFRDSRVPTDVLGITTTVVAIEAGSEHTCALVETNRSAKCWGRNNAGQVGDGSVETRYLPVDVKGLSNVLEISAGGAHTCALIAGGSVKCWGANTVGQLGDGSNTDSTSPVSVSGLDQSIKSISAGWLHTCALTSNGGVKCWGVNINGELGNGLASNSAVPVDVVGLDSNVIAINVGFDHTCALIIDAQVKCWGKNLSGQLGNNSVISSNIPVDVVDMSNGVRKISGGLAHTCGLLLNGKLKCWGANSYKQLAQETITGSLVPIEIMGLDPDLEKDSDFDSLPDIWEVAGIDVDDNGSIDVNLPLMGADPYKKDIFVEVDWMQKIDGGSIIIDHKPSPEAIKMIVDAFASAPVDNGKGINLHIDLGSDSIDYVTGRTWGELSKGNVIPFEQYIGSKTSLINDTFLSRWRSIAQLNFGQSRKVFHHALFAHQILASDLTSDCHSGFAIEQYIVITLGCFTNGVGDRQEQAGTFMHELGHSLGLKHGGLDDINHKPNYLSIMNYSFQMNGLLIERGLELTDGHFDYSRFALPNLDELKLNEKQGLEAGEEVNKYGTKYAIIPPYLCLPNGVFVKIARHANGPIDWNCNSIIGSLIDGDLVQANVNANDKSDEVLVSYNDWVNLKYDADTIGQSGVITSEIILKDAVEKAPPEITLEESVKIEPLWKEVYLPFISR